MKVRLYYLKRDTTGPGQGRDADLADLRMGVRVPSDALDIARHYDRVWSGDLAVETARRAGDGTPVSLLEALFYGSNMRQVPGGFTFDPHRAQLALLEGGHLMAPVRMILDKDRGHTSMSEADVVVLGTEAFVCKDVGFERLPFEVSE